MSLKSDLQMDFVWSTPFYFLLLAFTYLFIIKLFLMTVEKYYVSFKCIT